MRGTRRCRRRRASPRRRGFMFTDAVAGLLVVGVLAGVIFVAVNRHNRATARLADERQALRLAERALLELQADGSTKTAAEVRRLATPPLVAGKAWVEVTARHGERRASVVGLLDAAAVPPTTAPATAPVGGKEGP